MPSKVWLVAHCKNFIVLSTPFEWVNSQDTNDDDTTEGESKESETFDPKNLGLTKSHFIQEKGWASIIMITGVESFN